MIRFISIVLCFTFTTSLTAEESILDHYINIGLNSNLALKQQEFSLEQSMKALKEARGMYLPSLTLLSRYSRAGGGRTIEFPVGTIVNPIYETLNEILVGLGQNPKPFPVIPDQTIPFLREEEQETKIRLVQPIFQPRIYHNASLKSNLKDVQFYETTIFKRVLIKDIKIAYFNYLRAYYVIQLFTETQSLLQENLRVSEVLYDAQKVTRDAVYRAEAEIGFVEQNILEAKNNLDLSRSYLNFLLNRSLQDSVVVDESILGIKKYTFTLDTARVLALKNREEINQLRSAIEASQDNRKIVRSNYIPGLSAVVDYGIQGESYEFSGRDDYWMASLVFEWNIFRGFQDQARSESATLQIRKLETRLLELKQQLKLQVRSAYNNFMLAQKQIEVTNKQAQSSESSFKIVNKKYSEGMAAMIEFLDARSNMTRAQINRLLANYEYHRSFAELERVIAYYTINESEGNYED